MDSLPVDLALLPRLRTPVATLLKICFQPTKRCLLFSSHLGSVVPQFPRLPVLGRGESANERLAGCRACIALTV